MRGAPPPTRRCSRRSARRGRSARRRPSPRWKVSRWNVGWDGAPGRSPADEAAERRERRRPPRSSGQRTRRRAPGSTTRPLAPTPSVVDLAEVLADALQVAGEVARRGVALVGVLGETALHDPAQRRRRPRVEPARPARARPDDRGERLGAGRLLEGALARRHLVEDRAERELVRPEVHGPPARLLRRHVADRAHDGARLRLLRRRPSARRDACSVGATNSFARPKSSSLTKPSFETMTFSGFRSRCTIPAACALARPRRSARATSSSFFVGKRARREQLAQARPSTSSIAM